MQLSFLNFKKIWFSGKGILELLPSRRFFTRYVPIIALDRINSDSAVNYQLMDEESTGGMVI
jgi:hypothetical protein